jgi:hypothetical protein
MPASGGRTGGFLLSVIWLAVTTLTSGNAAAQPSDRPKLHTHQSYMEEVMRPDALDVKDPMAVLAFVLDSLPDTVTVYPTENYYYFTFTLNGVVYAGNIRLDASDRDQGKVQFGYYEQTTGWRDETPGWFRVLDTADGVKLEKLERFRYRLSYKGRSVVFALNDLSQVKPPPGLLAPREEFIGPIFDESGIRFFLVYNAAINNFLYILDETVKVADAFVRGPRGDRILVGKRTGFVFYRDHRRGRKILIGVYEENVRTNNYFDGPFDQLPDNFVEGDKLRDAILKVQPDLKGKIDRFGGTPDGEVRYSISPYLVYRELREFNRADRCAVRHRHAEAAYYRCFIFDNEPENLRAPPDEDAPVKRRKHAAPKD